MGARSRVQQGAGCCHRRRRRSLHPLHPVTPPPDAAASPRRPSSPPVPLGQGLAGLCSSRPDDRGGASQRGLRARRSSRGALAGNRNQRAVGWWGLIHFWQALNVCCGSCGALHIRVLGGCPNPPPVLLMLCPAAGRPSQGHATQGKGRPHPPQGGVLPRLQVQLICFAGSAGLLLLVRLLLPGRAPVTTPVLGCRQRCRGRLTFKPSLGAP